MEAGSMVHALEQIHDLLEPRGHLIDIRPNGELTEFIYPLEGQEHYFIGYMQETDNYIEYRQADEALQTALSKGWFEVLGSWEFEVRTYGHSMEELKNFIEESWSDAVVTEEVVANARKLEKAYWKRKVFLRERARFIFMVAV
jgi:hypothetical protein